MSQIRKPLVWQERCFEKFKKSYASKDSNYFAIIAGTGCGKTFVGSLCARHLLNEIKGSVLFVGVPYRGIKESWETCLTSLGVPAVADPIDMDEDTVAFISTYAGAKNCLNYIIKQIKKPIILLLDEFHHLEIENTWAEPYLNLKKVEHKILLSGTPWREGLGEKLFVDYRIDSEGNEVVDTKGNKGFKYTYGKNVNEDGDSRNTVKVQFEPHRIQQITERVSINPETGEETNLSPLKLDTDEMDAGSPLSPIVKFGDSYELRQRTALVDHILAPAICDVETIRNDEGLNDAAGVVFVSSKVAGEAVQVVMKEKFDIDATFLYSEDPVSYRSLKAFKDNGAKWIITIDMLSEGVDIPRLKVIADLSNRKTTLSLVQRWGRVLRRVRDKTGNFYKNDIATARIHFICHPALKNVADKIEEDVRKSYAEKRLKVIGPDVPDIDEPPVVIGYGDCTQEHEAKPSIFAGEDKAAAVTHLADWYVRTQKHERTAAFIIAESVIENGNYPEGYNKGFNLSDYILKTDSVVGKEQTVHEKKKMVIDRYKRIIGRIAGAISTDEKPDYKQANYLVNQEQSVPEWDRKNKTLKQLERRLLASKRVYRRVAI